MAGVRGEKLILQDEHVRQSLLQGVFVHELGPWVWVMSLVLWSRVVIGEVAWCFGICRFVRPSRMTFSERGLVSWKNSSCAGVGPSTYYGGTHVWVKFFYVLLSTAWCCI